MLLKETLKEVVELQKKELRLDESTTTRQLLGKIASDNQQIEIISGIRRCGKSTLLKQHMKKQNNFNYLNFEDPRIHGFDINDFQKLADIQKNNSNYYYDEIQNIDNWEKAIRNLHDNRQKIFITGSNASLLSKELGTKLTGRHITHELFPFSYQEFLEFKKKKKGEASLQEYLEKGGFPEFLKTEKTEILQELFRDIITRDITVRHNLKTDKQLKDLAIHLANNIGAYLTYNKLAQHFELGSTNTVIDYVAFLEDAYLIFTIPKFDYSTKKQAVNPKKPYLVDTGLVNAIATKSTKDFGKILENLVFLHLRRKTKNVFYYLNKQECDFIITKNGKPVKAIQVCWRLTEENKEREIKGLKEAMTTFKIIEGEIITLDQDDMLEGIHIVPAWKWLTDY